MADLIDRAALIKIHCEDCTAGIQEECKTDPVCGTLMWLNEAPTVDAVEVDVLKAWLYEIAMNNTDNYLGDACEEIISRLDGLRVFARERK